MAIEDDIKINPDVPRFVVSITDTQTIMGGQYYSISAGADKIADFWKLIPKKKRTNEARTELQNMFVHFNKAVADLDATPYEKIPETKNAIGEEE